jgi:branched-chain amino acid transport system substrate-binding protein
VQIVSSECTTVVGDYKNDNAVLVGSLAPTTGSDATTGKPIENAIKLAVGDFEKGANGLPPRPGTSARRPIVLVGCDDSNEPVKAAAHLVDDLGVQAVIGAAFSGVTIKVATDVTIPKGALLVSPSATSVAITSLQDNGLVWRTSPSDTLQASALALLVPQVEATVRQEYSIQPATPIKLAIVHKGDAYGAGLADTLQAKLQFNGKAALDNGTNYLRFDYGDPDATPPTTKYAEAITAVLNHKPHILLIFGVNEGVNEIFKPITQQWSGSTGHEPRYLFSDGGLLTELWTTVGSNDKLRKRVLGTVPGTNNNLFKTFRAAYVTSITDGTSPDTFGAAGGYDALYLIAYSVVAAGDKPLTGANLAEGMKKLVPPGKSVDVGMLNINTTYPDLLAGNSIDFNGASGPLDFDVNTGEAQSDIQIWCLPKDGNGAATMGQFSGLFYDPKNTSKLSGASDPSVCMP